MHEDDDEASGGAPLTKAANVAALPAQLGVRLRRLYAEAEAQPIPDRLRQLLEQLAAKERKPE